MNSTMSGWSALRMTIFAARRVFSARLDDPGERVVALHEKDRSRGGPAAGERLARSIRFRSRTSTASSRSRQAEDRLHRVVDRVDEAGRALRRPSSVRSRRSALLVRACRTARGQCCGRARWLARGSPWRGVSRSIPTCRGSRDLPRRSIPLPIRAGTGPRSPGRLRPPRSAFALGGPQRPHRPRRRPLLVREGALHQRQQVESRQPAFRVAVGDLPDGPHRLVLQFVDWRIRPLLPSFHSSGIRVAATTAAPISRRCSGLVENGWDGYPATTPAVAMTASRNERPLDGRGGCGDADAFRRPSETAPSGVSHASSVQVGLGVAAAARRSFTRSREELPTSTSALRTRLSARDYLVSARKPPFRAEIGANSWHSGRDVGAIPAATEAPDGLRTENGGKSARMSCFQGQ